MTASHVWKSLGQEQSDWILAMIPCGDSLNPADPGLSSPAFLSLWVLISGVLVCFLKEQGLHFSCLIHMCGCVGIRVCTFLFPCSPWPTSPINPASSIHDPTSFITGYDWEKSPLNEGKAATRLYPKRVSKGEWPYKQPRQQKSLVGLCNPATREKPQAQGLWEWFV